jgi:hypothetical protein
MIIARGTVLTAPPSGTAAARNWRRRSLSLTLFPFLSELGQHVPQFMIAQVHLSQLLSPHENNQARTGISYLASEVVRQSTVRVQHGQIGAAHIAHAQLLVARCARRVCKLLEIALKKC